MQRSPRKTSSLFALVYLLTVLVSGTACVAAITSTFAQGRAVRSFKLRGIDGKDVVINPAGLRRPLIVHLFSVQKPGWQQELRELQKLQARMRRKKAALVSSAAHTPTAKKILVDFAIAEGIRFPVGVDGPGGVFSAFTKDKVPRLVLLGPDGTVRWETAGAIGTAEIDTVAGLIPGLLKEGKALLKDDRKRAKEAKRAAKALKKTAKKIKRIKPAELRARIDAGEKLNLYFIGDKAQFEAEHIPGAVYLGFNDAAKLLGNEDRDREIILYCGCDRDDLGQSGRVAASLYQQGLRHAGFLEGHIQGWKKQGLPLVGGEESGKVR